MTGIIGKFSLFLLLVLPTTFMLAGPDGSGMVVGAQEPDADVEEDILEGEEDDDATVETDDGLDGGPDTGVTEGDGTEEEEEEEKPLKASPDGDSYILFTQPLGTDLPAGKVVKFLVGFTNKGDKEFMVESMDAAFRYPQDYSFYIQNFTSVRYDRVVEPQRQATFEYSFLPSETFNARPFGLTINLNYKDLDGNIFQDAVFNETVNVVEPDEGLDGETFFLYIFLAAIVVLGVVGAQQLMATFSKKRPSKPSKQIEMGTPKSDVDMDWIPQEAINELNKSPRSSPRSKTSPRNRRAKRAPSSGDD